MYDIDSVPLQPTVFKYIEPFEWKTPPVEQGLHFQFISEW